MKNKTNISVKDNRGVKVTPDLIIGTSGIYSSADILDANATAELIGEAVGECDSDIDDVKGDVSTLQNDVSDILESVYSINTSIGNIQNLITADPEELDEAIDKFEEIVDFLDGIEPGSELYEIIMSHIDNGVTKAIKHIEVYSQASFDAIASKDVHTEYNIIEG